MRFLTTSFLLLCLVSSCRKDHSHPVVKPPVVPPVVPPAGPDVIIGGAFVDSNGRSVEVWRNGVFSQTPDSNEVVAISLNGADLYTLGMSGAYFKNNALPAVQNVSGTGKILAYGNDVYITLNSFKGPQNGRIVPDDAAYWKNGQIVNLSHLNGASLTNSWTRDITHSGPDIYICGAAEADTDNVFKAAYWKNDTIHYLQNGPDGDYLGSSEADCISIVGDDIYIAGYGHPWAGYWVNGQFNKLESADYVYVSGIGVSGGTVDVLTNIIRQTAQSYTFTTGIAVNGNDVYIVGGDSSGNAILWINGIAHILGAGRADCITIGQ